MSMDEIEKPEIVLPDKPLNACAERLEACETLDRLVGGLVALDTTTWDDDQKLNLITDLRIAVQLLCQWEPYLESGDEDEGATSGGYPLQP
jgi:hypothetical protein